MLKTFPIVCVLGPRQCGKTTFIRSALTGWEYLDLEKPSDLARVSQDPQDALNRLQRHFILDEAQQCPEL
ncbi:MAG: AAA family ATPase, partial [Deltaproteobacteria bacterium]|nr:AAA family ATPase [Deltaproteobacteria bacterium]